MADAFAVLGEVVPCIYVLLGNHDYLQQGHAYFEFLRHLPNVHFVTRPWDDTLVDNTGPPALFLPHTHNPVRDWQSLDMRQFQYVFMHQTAPGSIASNGQKMAGQELPSLKGPKVYSGDIHVPQVLGDIEYIGSPYHVHFGDSFTPRCVLIDKRGRPVDLHMESPRRLSIKVSSFDHLVSYQLREGDQVKVTLQLQESEKHEWHKLRQLVLSLLQDKGVECCGVKLEVQRSTRRLFEPGARTRKALPDAERLLQFVEAEGLGGDALDLGLELL